MKRFLGIICLLYSSIFGYVIFFDKLKNFLAPSMQIYIKLSLIPMIFIGLVMLFNNKVNYKFKISDLILLLPLILLIFAGDGRLTSNFASNKMTNLNNENKTIVEDKKEEKLDQNIVEEKIKDNTKTNEEKTTYDFSNVDFNIVDSTYNELADYLTYAPKAIEYTDKKIRVKGFIIKDLSSKYYIIGKYSITCCAADATFVGFYFNTDYEVKENKWYEIEGILKKENDNYVKTYIEAINIKEIDSKKEEQYVYPCYAYDNGLCTDISKYNLEY